MHVRSCGQGQTVPCQHKQQEQFCTAMPCCGASLCPTLRSGTLLWSVLYHVPPLSQLSQPNAASSKQQAAENMVIMELLLTGLADNGLPASWNSQLLTLNQHSVLVALTL